MSKKKILSNRSNASAQVLESRTLFAAAFSPITFAASVNFVAGTNPVALAVADFNGDGNVDVAVADQATDKVNIFFGNGTGAFSTGPVLSLNAPPVAVIASDFNGDSKPDLAVASTAATGQTTTSATVFLNAGAGTFGLGQIATVESNALPGEPVAIAAGDFNNDQHLDLAVTGYSSQSVNILLGSGAGTFAAPVTYSANQYPTGIVSGNFSNNGIPGLAVTSTSVNVFSGASNDGSATNQLSLLTGSASGNFSGGSNVTLTTTGTPSGIALIKLTSTSAVDSLLVTNTDGTVAVLANHSGTLSSASVATVNGGATAVAAGDFNLDGNTDFVAAGGSTSMVNNSNAVTVVPGLGDGTLSAASRLSTGSNPAGVVVADFNNDAKPDIATANQNDGTVSILLNSTALSQITTSVAVTSSQDTAPAGTAVTFTATVTPASVSTLSGESVPTGTVKFFDGSALLGSAAIVAAGDFAQFATSGLIVGNQPIHAVYSGDTAYAASTSSRITQVISPTATQGPDLVGTLVSSTWPTTVAPGETGVVKIKITNEGNTPAVGSITNLAYLSLDSIVDGGDLPLTLRGALAKTNLRLPAGKSIILTGTTAVPQSAPIASYSLLVQLDSTGSLAESVATNDTVVSPTPNAVADVFGTVGGRAGVVLQTTDASGIAATFRLTGPGNGTVNIGDSGVQIVLDGTTAASTLSVTTARGSAPFVVTDLSADSAIGNIRAPLVNVTGDLSLSGGAASVLLDNVGSGVTPGTFTLGAGSVSTLKFSSVAGLTLNAVGGIKSLSVSNWDSGSIQAGWIGTLRSAQQFAPNLTLTGTGAPGGTALSSVSIGGLASGGWTVTGNIGRVALASTPAALNGWTLSDSGSLKSLSMSSSFYGYAFATSIGSVQILGDLIGGEIAANSNLNSILVRGNLDNADVLAATTAIGTLGSVRVTGTSTGSLVNAGTETGGVLRALTVLGAVDDASKFVAAVLPKRAVIAGMSVIPSADPHFHF